MSALVLSAVLAFAPLGYGDELTIDQAARQAEARYGGQVLDIQTFTTDGGKDYRIKLLQPGGRVKLLVINARDGSSQNFRRDDARDDSGRGRGRGRGGD